MNKNAALSKEEKSEPLKRGIYLLPNLLTTVSLFTAFYSIVSAMSHHFEKAVIAIFLGMITDGLDGRVARMTHTQTAFGAEYDSLSDMVTFGVAPALLSYNWTLHYLGKPGWLLAFVYTAAVALRLARFNTQLGVANKRYFQGLACPSAAGVIVSLVWTSQKYYLNILSVFPIIFGVIIFLVSFLMVSNIRYYSFKDFDFKGRVPFLYILISLLLIVAIAFNPSLVLFLSFTIYAFSGPVHTLLQRVRIKESRSKNSGNTI